MLGLRTQRGWRKRLANVSLLVVLILICLAYIGITHAQLGSELIDRIHDVGTEEMHSTNLFERPFSIGTEFENNFEYKKDSELVNDVKDDVLGIEQILTLHVFYPLTGDISLFLGIEIFNEGVFQTEVGKHEIKTGIGREEAWLFVGNLFESGFSLQIGRQEFEEDRQWWWGDEELDVLRIHYDRRRLHADLSVGQEMAKRTTAESRIDPEEEDVLRVIGQAAWGWEENQRLDAFFLYQKDHSSRQSVGQPISERLEDPVDADLLWVGGRASGQLCSDRFGEFEYWLDAAGVFGKETLFEFEETEKGVSLVSSRLGRDVGGWAIDVGLTWWSNLTGKPFLTLDYARGSGDRQSDPSKDQSFRQTGLHANEDRFEYYGKLLEPELSNLQIWTASLGFRFWESCSIELLYHNYRQVRPSSFLRGASIEVDLEGTRRDIGQEWDLIIILEKWEGLEFEISGALFRPGSAYGSLSGENAYYTAFEMVYRF